MIELDETMIARRKCWPEKARPRPTSRPLVVSLIRIDALSAQLTNERPLLIHVQEVVGGSAALQRKVTLISQVRAMPQKLGSREADGYPRPQHFAVIVQDRALQSLR
jgi:hypothetical protein